MIRKLLPIVAFVAALCAAPAYARVADHNPLEVTDPAGDSGGAPDITRVTVANSLDGFLLFVVQVANRDAIVTNDRVSILIDSDQNGTTGAPAGDGGVDYIIRVDGTSQTINLGRWNGTAFETATTTTLRGGWGPGYVAGISRTELGNTTGFDFVVLTSLEAGPPDQADIAPTGVYQRYAVSPPHIATIVPGFSTLKPRAATTFRLKTVQLKLDTDETTAAGTFTCKATLAGKSLRGTGAGGCTFKLPKTAKGKRLAVTITAAPAGGKAQTFAPYVFRIR